MKHRALTALALVAVMMVGPPTVLADPFFGAKADFGTGSYPCAVAIGDLNGDGRQDLVTANYGANTISVLLGTGTGTFGARTDYPTGSNPRFVAIGDLDGDGKPDLAVANLFSGTVSVLLGNGDGSFGARTDFGTGSRPWSLAIGDLDGDGKPDLAVANSNAATVSVLLGHGNGTFAAKTDFATGSFPYSVAIGDLNGDGKPDLAAASGIGVSVLLGNGSGTFSARADYATGSVPVSVAIGDLSGDGIPDLAVANYSSNTVSVLLGNGGGTFAAGSNHATGLNPFVVAIGHLDGDTNADLAVANSTSNSVSVLPGSGGGAFGARTDFGTGTGPFAVAIADLNGDGRQDLATANYGANTVSVLLWQLVPTLASVASSPNPSYLGAAVTLTAFVTPAGATGSVTFHDGVTALGTATLAAGVATISTATLGPGNHGLTATYAGNAVFAPSVSPVAAHAVIPIDSTTLALASNPSPSVFGQAVLLTASVNPVTATGSVEFRNAGAPIGTASLSGGHATLSVPGLNVGNHLFTAVYAGDPGHYGSASPGLAHVVNPAPTVVAVVSGLNPSRLTQAVSFTASVRDSAGSPALVTGSVEFVIDSVVLGAPVALSGGSASVTGITSLAVGSHTVRVLYSGSASYLGSTSPTLTQVVESPVPALVAVRDVPNDQGGHVELQWNASDLDPAPPYSIESYWILRSAPAAIAANAARAGVRIASAASGPIDARVGGFVAVRQQGVTYYWEFVSSRPATQVPTYSVVVPTTCDSTAGSNPLTAFMIMARTIGGAQWWFSDPDSGYSVDNLAPLAPAAFTGAYGTGATSLRWSGSPEADLGQYRLYRGVSADFVPGADNLVMAGADTGYVDAAAAPCWYKLCAVDVHGNASDFALLQPSGTTGVGGGGMPVFALEGARPNPTRGEQLRVAFTLRAMGSARLELMDVSGRRMVEREVGALGAGSHSVSLAPERRLAPGLYLLRLTQGSDVRVTAVTVLK